MMYLSSTNAVLVKWLNTSEMDTHDVRIISQHCPSEMTQY